MAIQSWSDNILVVELQDDPVFTDELVTVLDQVGSKPNMDVVLDFAGVRYANSSNLAKLLKLRKMLVSSQRRLVLCNIDTAVWGIFMVTGLEKVFEFADNVATALASLQIERSDA